MKIAKVETFLTNAGLRNYMFVRLTTDTGVTGLGEATLEWQELTVETLIHEWIKDRVIGEHPFDIERIAGGLIRDQYQGGATVMTAISGVEIALWDIVGKLCNQPVYRLFGGRAHDRMPAYANGWYGGARTPADYARLAKNAIALGYGALKFDPFGTAWKELKREEAQTAESIVAAVREAVGDSTELMIEFHGRLSASHAIEIGRRLSSFRPAWYEEPVTPNSLEALLEVKNAVDVPVAAGERIYTLEGFAQLAKLRAADIVQMDPAHCGGLLASKKIAAMAEACDMRIAPHCSIGPVALCAALHLDWSTPNASIQENFSDFDVAWRNGLVNGWNPIRSGEYLLPEGPGLGLELNVEVCRQHPYKPNSFPSLWDQRWLKEFTSGSASGNRA